MSDDQTKPTGTTNFLAPTGTRPSSEEVEAAKPSEMPDGVRDITAIYADRLFLSWWKGHIRIAFGEEVGQENRWRSAITIETRTARDLVRRVQRALVDLGEEEKPEEKSNG